MNGRDINQDHPGRRALLQALALLGLSGTAARAQAPGGAAATVPEAATLLVPGPEDGLHARMARQAAASFARGLMEAAALRVVPVGGADGITAANRFAAAIPADGRALLVLPGAAMMALLVGDSRARFEPRHWPALCGALRPAVLAARRPMTGPAAPLRLALPGPGSAEVAALLALDLIGRGAEPVFTAEPERAVATGAADALVLVGADTLQLAARGLHPWFAFDATGPRDPAPAAVPLLADLIPDPPRADLMAALRAAGAALRTDAVVVLPSLTSADSVALWRGAARGWAEAPPDGVAVRRLPAGEAAGLLAVLCAAPSAAVAYREWLYRRVKWRAA
jgi:hypothetical protein